MKLVDAPDEENPETEELTGLGSPSSLFQELAQPNIDMEFNQLVLTSCIQCSPRE